MEFQLTPFSESELKHDYEFVEFLERGYPMAMLNRTNFVFSPSKTKYKFGLIHAETLDYYWFFLGKAVIKDRLRALQTYNALLYYCDNKKIGQPFAFKDF